MNLSRSPGVFLIMGLCIAAYLALAALEQDFAFSPRAIATWGGLLPLEWLDGEYWRFLSAGFLHFSLAHIATNMVCLIMWGLPLERIYGTERFLPLYLLSVIGGSMGSVLLHEERFVGAGASGGMSGLLGALLMLTLLRRIDLPPQFFAINIGLNIAVALLAPGVDWQAHLAGFVTGLAVAALLKPRGILE